jgi:NADPH2:quinone reductase
MTETMRAVVLDAPGPPDALSIRDVPIPSPPGGWVLIRVKAFGLNRSELHTRLGLADGVTFPRVLGIEAAGVVAACPGGEFDVGQQVMAMMGGPPTRRSTPTSSPMPRSSRWASSRRNGGRNMVR